MIKIHFLDQISTHIYYQLKPLEKQYDRINDGMNYPEILRDVSKLDHERRDGFNKNFLMNNLDLDEISRLGFNYFQEKTILDSNQDNHSFFIRVSVFFLDVFFVVLFS